MRRRHGVSDRMEAAAGPTNGSPLPMILCAVGLVGALGFFLYQADRDSRRAAEDRAWIQRQKAKTDRDDEEERVKNQLLDEIVGPGYEAVWVDADAKHYHKKWCPKGREKSTRGEAIRRGCKACPDCCSDPPPKK